MFERLRILRNEKGVTCEQLSILLGLKTRGAYQKKEAENVPFTLEEAKKIADFFKKNINEVFFTHEVYCEDTEPKEVATK